MKVAALRHRVRRYAEVYSLTQISTTVILFFLLIHTENRIARNKCIIIKTRCFIIISIILIAGRYHSSTFFIMNDVTHERWRTSLKGIGGRLVFLQQLNDRIDSFVTKSALLVCWPFRRLRRGTGVFVYHHGIHSCGGRLKKIPVAKTLLTVSKLAYRDCFQLFDQFGYHWTKSSWLMTTMNRCCRLI